LASWGATVQVNRAQNRLKALAAMEPIAAAVEDPSLVFDFPSPKELRPPLIVLDDAAVGYVAGVPVLSRLNLRIDPDDRLALVGRNGNGNGKTTLARLLAGQLKPMGRSLVASGKLWVGYFAQHRSRNWSRTGRRFSTWSACCQELSPARSVLSSAASDSRATRRI
jgi:ATP-binding cassette subfamily F protein 3